MTLESVVIVAAKRTPMGGFMGALTDAQSTELGATAIASALAQTGLANDAIDEVIMGCVLPAGLVQNSPLLCYRTHLLGHRSSYDL